jgi:6-hydroxycyclohex-1-ene-1-carbonyl-CoA dehydrogenase
VSRTEGAHGFRLTSPGADLSQVDLPPLSPADDQVVVQVAGCGICHTDISYAYGGVPTRHPLPLILGHEIAGKVVDAGVHAAEWIGRSVIVPAVIPCGKCEACRAGRPTICRHQFMPGNDGDGGFATHVVVPSRGLCHVPDVLPNELTLDMLAIVADAVTTPYEAMERAQVTADDLVVVVGVGGIGGFAVQIAAARGAQIVAIDVDDDRLKLALTHGASLALNPKVSDLKSMKTSIRGFARETGRGKVGTKIFEMSGTTAGQETAFGLLDFGSYLAVVGYTPDKVAVRLSNLMALDATARGNWGCAPENYPKALALVLDRKIVLEPYVERHSLADLPRVFRAAARHEIRRRVIVTP